jgi:hypothetical protein
MPISKWTDENTLRFLYFIVQATGVSPAAHFATIAEKLGEFTTSALSQVQIVLRVESIAAYLDQPVWDLESVEEDLKIFCLI